MNPDRGSEFIRDKASRVWFESRIDPLVWCEAPVKKPRKRLIRGMQYKPMLDRITGLCNPSHDDLEALTTRQQQIYDFIVRYSDKAGMPPTRAEIASFMGFRSANAAEDHLKALARKGVISLTPGTSRGIRIQAGQRVSGFLPVVGRVAAGSPILAQEHISDRMQVAPDSFRPRADYLLKVKGTSMRDAGILDGDLLAVHQTSDVANGQIVVARVNDEVTVKRFHRRGNKVRLLPENPDFQPIIVDLKQQELTIEGLGVGVLRDKLARS